MYPTCIAKLTYIQKQLEPEQNNPTSENPLMLLFLGTRESTSTFSLRAQLMVFPFLLPTLSMMLNQISISKRVNFHPAMFRLINSINADLNRPFL